MIGPRSFPFVRSVLRVEEVDSTSDLARRKLDDPEFGMPALVWADRQTRGRGQGSNAWWSGAGSLTATVVLDPSRQGLNPERQPRVALATAVAIVEAIRDRYPSCRAGIRWPNDVEVGGRKLGGILPERVETPQGPRLLIGIGVNVANRLDLAPESIRSMAATLADWEPGPPPNEPIARLLAAILDRLAPALQGIASGDEGMVVRWNRLDTLGGSRVRIAIGSETIEGVADGIDTSGGLRLRVDSEVRVIHAGRVLRNGEKP